MKETPPTVPSPPIRTYSTLFMLHVCKANPQLCWLQEVGRHKDRSRCRQLSTKKKQCERRDNVHKVDKFNHKNIQIHRWCYTLQKQRKKLAEVQSNRRKERQSSNMVCLSFFMIVKAVEQRHQRNNPLNLKSHTTSLPAHSGKSKTSALQSSAYCLWNLEKLTQRSFDRCTRRIS